MDLYETYLRDTEGRTWHPESIREGLDHFLSDEGYRISFNIDGVVITLRRNSQVEPRFNAMLNEKNVDCSVTIR